MNKVNTLVVNFWAGPSVGKTTTALGVAYKLKMMGVEATYIPEYAKEIVVQGHMNLLEYQDEITAEQMKRQRIFNGISDVIVVDSPIAITLYYAKESCKPGFRAWVLEAYDRFNNLNYFLTRNPAIPYDPRGRYQDESGARLVDVDLQRVLDESSLPYLTCQPNDTLVDDIVLEILTNIRSQNERTNVSD